MKLDFQEYGAGNPVVLLHAFPLSSSMWDQQIAPIVKEGWRLILPNFPGFGKSTIEFQSEITGMENVAQALSDLLSQLKIEQCVIGGLSMGGYAALNFARMFPEKLFALRLADTSAAADSEEKRESRFSLIKKVKEKGVEVLIDEMFPQVISEYTKNNNKELVFAIEQEFRKASEDGVIAALLGMAERREQTEFLEHIKPPTLLIFGQEDKITNLDAAEIMNRKIANSTLVTIPDSGHYSNLEQPEMFNNALINFLKNLK